MVAGPKIVQKVLVETGAGHLHLEGRSIFNEIITIIDLKTQWVAQAASHIALTNPILLPNQGNKWGTQ